MKADDVQTTAQYIPNTTIIASRPNMLSHLTVPETSMKKNVPLPENNEMMTIN